MAKRKRVTGLPAASYSTELLPSKIPAAYSLVDNARSVSDTAAAASVLRALSQHSVVPQTAAKRAPVVTAAVPSATAANIPAAPEKLPGLAKLVRALLVNLRQTVLHVLLSCNERLWPLHSH